MLQFPQKLRSFWTGTSLEQSSCLHRWPEIAVSYNYRPDSHTSDSQQARGLPGVQQMHSAEAHIMNTSFACSANLATMQVYVAN